MYLYHTLRRVCGIDARPCEDVAFTMQGNACTHIGFESILASRKHQSIASAAQPYELGFGDTYIYICLLLIHSLLYRHGHLEIVNVLIDAEICQVDAVNNGGFTALHCAAE